MGARQYGLSRSKKKLFLSLTQQPPSRMMLLQIFMKTLKKFLFTSFLPSPSLFGHSSSMINCVSRGETRERKRSSKENVAKFEAPASTRWEYLRALIPPPHPQNDEINQAKILLFFRLNLPPTATEQLTLYISCFSLPLLMLLCGT